MVLEALLGLKYIQNALDDQPPVCSEIVLWLNGMAEELKTLQNRG